MASGRKRDLTVRDAELMEMKAGCRAALMANGRPVRAIDRATI
jgi:hypothetical protein